MLSYTDLDICAVTETWFKVGIDYMSKSIDNDKYVWISRERQNQKARNGEGGVGIIIKRSLGKISLVRVSKRYDMIWVEIDRNGMCLYIAAVYISPSRAPRGYYSTEMLAELEVDILHFKSKGQVMVMGDFNARIGTEDTSFTHNGHRIFVPRRSKDQHRDARGRQLIESMNACNMVILHGLDSPGIETCWNGCRGKSVVDYIIIGKDIFQESNKIQYESNSMKIWEEDYMNVSDHRLLTCRLKFPIHSGIVEETAPGKEVMNSTEKWKRNDCGDRKYWERMEELGNEVMGSWIERIQQVRNIETTDLVHSYQEHLDAVLNQTLGTTTYRKRKRKRFVWDQQIHEAVWEEKAAYRLWKQTQNEIDLQQFRNKKKTRKKLVRNQEKKQNQEIVARIEQLRNKNPKEYWRQLKKLNETVEKKNIPNKIKNDNNEWVVDEQGIREVWARAFERLGKNTNNGNFDEQWAERVSKRVERESKKNRENLNEVLNQPIMLEETRIAISKLKRGKAVGVDNYMNEIFLYGGEKIEEATWILCREVFRQEKLPATWTQGLIFPIFKGGTEDERHQPDKYRGITLLSVLGKIYASILNDRATEWIERKGILVEEQAGFRKDRATMDQLFILTEIIKNRRPEGTYVGFIDIQKAYDRVWRKGLWYKLHKYGITGKFWRVLRNIYESVESCVVVNGTQSRWFSVETGLRQGCLLSPILFAIYINGLAEEIQRVNLGVQLMGYKNDRLGILMYADDIALIARSRLELQKALEVIYEYSRKWRFTFNFEKCAVMVFKTHKLPHKEMKYGDCSWKCTCGRHWKLGDQLIKQVNSYKYLGVDLDSNLSFERYKKRIKEKARKNVSRIWYMGMYDGCLSVKACINLYQALVRSVLEYGCEIWGMEEWEEGERVQREFGRRILRSNGKTTNEAVLGELGWWRLQTRRDYCKLKYWIKILMMDNTRLIRNIYNTSKQRYWIDGTSNWCRSIHILAKKYNLLNLWNDESRIYQYQGDTLQLRQKWTNIIFEKIRTVEQEHWLRAINRKPKLRTYRTFKFKLELETYLLSEQRKAARYLLTSIRSGTNKLRIETGRWTKPKEAPEERICRACLSGEIEDEKHFVLHCKAYNELRDQMIHSISIKTYNKVNLKTYSKDNLWVVLMNPHRYKVQISEALKEYLQRAMKKRAKI